MKKFYLIIFSILSFFLFSPFVNAYTNQDTYYNITMPSYKTDLENKTCGNSNLFDYINYIIEQVDFSTSYYQVFITKRFDINAGNNPYIMSLIPTSYINSTNHYFSPYSRFVSGGYPTTQFYFNGLVNRTSEVTFYFNNCSSSLDVYNATWTKNLINRIKTNDNTIVNSNLNNNLGLYSVGISTTGFSYPLSYSSSNILSNTASYNIFGWYYYSSYDIYYIPSTNLNSSYYYKKVKLLLEEQEFTYEDKFLSYYDYYVKPKNPTFLGYKESIDTIYSNLPTSSINNYNLSISFNVPSSILGYSQEPQEYIDNLNFNYICSGRVNYTNYYTYENIPCSLTSSYSINNSKITYTFDSFNSTSNLSNYDKIYITINTDYIDSNINKVIYDFNYDYNYGDFYITSFKGNIYEDITNLPLNFKIYLSSNNSIVNSNLYVYKGNFIDFGVNYSGYSNVTNKQNLIVGNSILGGLSPDNSYGNDFIKFSVSNEVDTGLMIYQNNSSIPLPKLSLFFNENMILSINNISNDFYYIDNQGNIVNGSFAVPITDNNNDYNYNISYYVNIVNSFIDELSQDSIQFGLIVQDFYNSLPIFFQTFIFVIFILFCIYFTYILIKK